MSLKSKVTLPTALLALATAISGTGAVVQSLRLGTAQTDGTAASGAQGACCMIANACVAEGYTILPGGGVAPP